ncbi:MAG: 6-phosphogluconolactonase [Acidobacteria bacterium]|nr:MAG: 6-phosphogluconolactonase [Acidobacteriota bacterium]
MHLLTTPTRGSEKAESQVLIYVGTYTITKSKGIYAYRFDAATGRLTSVGLVANTTNPSFLAVHPSRRFLYAANEIANYESGKSGGVSAFAIDRESGILTFLNEVSSRGADPCYVSLDKTGKFVLVANYSGGSIAVFPVLEDGRMGEASAFVQHTGSSVNPKRQEGPHAHSIDTSPDNRFLLAADLGLDRLLVYRFDPFKGLLEPNDPAFAKINPGAGPRHFAFHPGGRFVYAVNEMGSSISAFSYDAARGSLRELQTISMLPKDFASQSDAAEIEVHPGGKFLYGSNRGHDSIAVFAIEAGKGTLTPVEYVSTQGKTPRNFAIDPTGSYMVVANQDSDNLVVFRIDAKTGRLTPNGKVPDVPSPVCVKFVALD